MPQFPNNIQVRATPVFFAIQRAYHSAAQVIVNEGGTRSSKTYSAAQFLIYLCLTEKLEVSVVSHSLPHLKRGARKDILEVLERWGLFREDDFHRTDNIYRFPSTGSYIEFFSADAPDKVRGPSRDILFINEANLVPETTYRQLAIRTRKKIILDLNPAEEWCWCYQIADDPLNKKIHSTYKNNLTNLTAAQIKQIEDLKDIDEEAWRVYGLGLRGASTHTIFRNWTEKAFSDDKISGAPYYGLDFGFTHPNSLVKTIHAEEAFYSREKLHLSGLTNSELAGQIRGLVEPDAEIFCDYSRPEAIQELCLHGLNCKPAVKDVLEGIKHMKTKPWIIHPESINLLKEVRGYKWKLDKDGKIFKPEQPVKVFDDAMDAARYSIYSPFANYYGGGYVDMG